MTSGILWKSCGVEYGDGGKLCPICKNCTVSDTECWQNLKETIKDWHSILVTFRSKSRHILIPPLKYLSLSCCEAFVRNVLVRVICYNSGFLLFLYLNLAPVVISIYSS